MNRPKIEDFIYCNSIIDDEKYEKALEEYCDELEKAVEAIYKELFIKAVDKIDELEKREKPMIVHKKSPMEELRLGNAWFCPNCDNWLVRVNNVNYCPDCGQRVVFEDE